MAITLQNTGAIDYPLSAYNSNSLRYSSNNNNIANIIYRVRNMQTGQYITPELRQPPISTGSAFFHIDISQYVQGAFDGYPTEHFNFYQDTYLNGTSSASTQLHSGIGLKQFRLDYKEEEVGSDGLLTSPANLTTGETFFFMQSVRQHDDYYKRSQLNFFDYIITNGQASTKRFLTNMPRTGVPICDHNYNIHFNLFTLTKDTNAPDIEPHVQLSPNASVVGLGNATGFQQSIVAHKYSPAAINDLNGMQFNLPTYNFRVRDTGTTDLTEIFTFNTKKCNCKDTISLMWVNPYGVIDYFTFTGAIEKVAVASSSVFTKYKGYRRGNNQGILIGTNGNTFNQPFGVNGKINIRGNKKIQILSQIITTDVGEWLTEILTSPKVYIIREDAPFVQPVIVKSNEMEFKQENSGLVRVGFEMEFANPRNTQRG